MPLHRARTARAWSSRTFTRRWPAMPRAWFRPAASASRIRESNRPFMIHRAIQPATCRLPISRRSRFRRRPTSRQLRRAAAIRRGSRRATACSNRAKRRLKARDRDRALQLFQQASAYSNDLDPVTAAQASGPPLAAFRAAGRPAAERSVGPAGFAGRRGRGRPAGLAQAGLRRRQPSRGRRQEDAGERPQDGAGHVAGNAQEGRSRRAGAGRPRPVAAAAGPLDRRHAALYRAEPLADRVGREERRRPQRT